MKKLANLMPGIILTIIGLLILLVPTKVVMIVTAVVAIYLLVLGLRNLYLVIKVFSAVPGALRVGSIVKNVVNIIFGAVVLYFAISRPEIILSVLVYIIALDLLVSALIDALDIAAIRRMGGDGIGFFDVVLHVIFAVLMFFFPKLIASTVLTIIGVIALVIGVLMAVGSIYSMNPGSHKGTKDDPIDVEWEEKKQ